MAASCQSRDTIFGKQLLFLEPGDLDLFGRAERAPPLEHPELLIEAAMFGGELFQNGLLRTLGRGRH
jgi:hypothetical protein